MKSPDRFYRTIANVAVLAALGAFGLICAAALGYLRAFGVAGVSLWPVVVLALIGSVFVASWAYAKAKGRSGWLGICLPFLDVLGLEILFRLKDRERKGRTS